MSLRGNIAKSRAGGPPFRLDPSRILVEVDSESNLTAIAESARRTMDDLDVDTQRVGYVERTLSDIGFKTDRLDEFGVVVASANRVADVVENIRKARDTFRESSIEQLEAVKDKALNRGNRTILGGFRSGDFGESNVPATKLEASLRNELSDIQLHNPLTKAVNDIDGVFNAEISYTRNTPGPRNLGVDPSSKPDITEENKEEFENLPDLGNVIDRMGVRGSWSTTRGENVVVAVFDTSFCKDYFDESRIMDTFSGDDVESAFSAPEEGHGTMTAYTAAGNKEESPVDYNGVAPDADLLLARLSGSDGALSNTEQAWNWLSSKIKQIDKPVISNHSYGVPLCSAKTMNLCESTSAKLARVMNQRDDHQGFYAAGNAGIYCGHRLSGLTNGINGINSDPSSITVGALRFDTNEAQLYSSHGYGTCTDSDTDPKPDVSSMIPTVVPYGCKLKDMSSRSGGSSAGTSEASPIVCGVGALVASVTGSAETEEIQDALESTATLPRRTQVNIINGYDARFGKGQVRAGEAISEVTSE